MKSSSSDNNHYERLEKITQKYEGEIRNHIRVEVLQSSMEVKKMHLG